jgi:molybdopterin-guanine dinucleotide biosynthesis protein A
MPFGPATERTGIILAGGPSPAADWQWRPGISLLRQAERILARAGVERVIVSGTESVESGGVLDLQPGCGPLGGLASVLQQRDDICGHCLLVIPADMPALNPRALTRLAEIAEFHGRGARFDLGPLPLALMHTRQLPEHIDATLQDGGSIEGLAERLGLPILASLPDDGLDNPASPEELDEIRQRLDDARAESMS